MISLEEFIFNWQHADFSNYNEMDIREDFIKDLLFILGYSKNTINDVIREKTLNISEPFQRVGRQRVQIDYVPTIRLKSFWIIEAKPGINQKIELGDMLQAYLYATHPEVQVPYIVLCNGWELLIFDVNEVSNWKVPMFSISNQNCTEKFEELKEILSAEKMLSFQRKRLLKQIHDTFEVEIDSNQLFDFKRRFNEMSQILEKKIKENEKELWRNAYKKDEEEQRELIKNAENSTLILWMDTLGYNSGLYYLEYLKRLEAANPTDRTNMLRLLMQTYLGRSHSIFKINCLLIFLSVVDKKLLVEETPYMRSPAETLKGIVENNVTYFDGDEMQNALVHMDKICCKLSALVIKNGLMDAMYELVKNKEKTLPIEEKLIRKPTVAREMVPLINIYAELLWRLYSHKNNVKEMWGFIWGAQSIAEEIEQKGDIKKYPDDDSDLLWYESYGEHFDLLYRVTVDIIKKNYKLMKQTGITQDILKLGELKTDEIVKLMPKIRAKSDDYVLNNELIKQIIYTLLYAIDLQKRKE